MPDEAVKADAKQQEVAGPLLDSPGHATSSFGSAGIRSSEQAILDLQRTAGNQATTRLLLGGVQRAPKTAADVWGGAAREDEDRTTAGAVGLLGPSAKLPQSRPSGQAVDAPKAAPTPGHAPGPARSGQTPKPAAPVSVRPAAPFVSFTEQWQLDREAKERAEHGETDVGATRVSEKPPELMSAPDIDDEIHRLERIAGKRVTDNESGNERQQRLTQLKARRTDLMRAGQWNPAKSKTDRGKDDEAVRQRDWKRAINAIPVDSIEGARMAIRIVEGIRPDGNAPGWALITASGMVMSIREDEVETLRAGTADAVDQMVNAAFAPAIEALRQFEGRQATNARHSVVHAIAKPVGKDLSSKEVEHDYEVLSTLRNAARAAARSHQFSSAVDHVETLADAVQRFGQRIERWENRLITGARIWAIGLMVLKDLLVLYGSGGLGVMLKGASAVRTASTVLGTTAYGGTVAAGASAAHQYAMDKDVSFGTTAKAFGVGAGESFGMFGPAASSKMKDTFGVTKATTELGKYGGGAAVDLTVAAGIGAPAGLMKGDSGKDIGIGIAGSTFGGALGQASKDIAGGNRVVERSLAGVAGGTQGAGQALAAGKSGEEVIAAGLSGGIGGSVSPDLEDHHAR